MGSDYTPAKWMPTTHFWKGRGGNTPKWIIVHGTAGGGTAENVAQYFVSNNPPTSTHFVVGRDGTVVQCVSESDSAWGNGVVTQGHDAWWSSKLNPNFVTFSIEHCKPDTGNKSDLTQQQTEASFALIAHLCEKYNIPRRAADANGGITGHYSIDPVNRAFCPGPYPWDDLWAYLNDGGVNTVGVPQGWKDDGKTLTAPNGQKVVLGFRWYILTHTWQADNYPLEPEYGANPIDITAPSSGVGTVQHFRRSILGWQKSNNTVTEMWSGAIAQAWQKRATTAGATTAKSVTTNVVGASQTTVTSAAAGQMTSNTTAFTAVNTSQPPMPYTPPGTDSSGEAGSYPASEGQEEQPTGSLSVIQTRATSLATEDPLSLRISSLEGQIQKLIQGIGSTNAGNGGPVGGFAGGFAGVIEQGVETIGEDIIDPAARKRIFGNKSVWRWILMIVGFLVSDAVAWAISTLVHHQTSLPLPILTAGTVFLSGILVVVGAFRFGRF